jgi:hypothetical protein
MSKLLNGCYEQLKVNKTDWIVNMNESQEVINI